MEQVHEGRIRFQAAQVVDDHGEHRQIQHDLQPQALPCERSEPLVARRHADHGKVGHIDDDQNRGDLQGPRRIQTDPVAQERVAGRPRQHGQPQQGGNYQPSQRAEPRSILKQQLFVAFRKSRQRSGGVRSRPIRQRQIVGGPTGIGNFRHRARAPGIADNSQMTVTIQPRHSTNHVVPAFNSRGSSPRPFLAIAASICALNKPS